MSILSHQLFTLCFYTSLPCLFLTYLYVLKYAKSLELPNGWPIIGMGELDLKTYRMGITLILNNFVFDMCGSQ